MFHVPEKFRWKKGPLASSEKDGNNGCFVIPVLGDVFLQCIASDRDGWEHVSATLRWEKWGKPTYRIPLWDEMVKVKMIFWDEEDTVIQYHPPKSEYVNQHPFVLHLWRPIGVELPKPPSWMIGQTKKD